MGERDKKKKKQKLSVREVLERSFLKVPVVRVPPKIIHLEDGGLNHHSFDLCPPMIGSLLGF
jgi:hypothetical protein